ncbi:hypothetical protein I6F11_29595 [Ensifer sp. NBAIM29]|nr:hypothetical protein [Ensifer sp. NBAIM29]
MDIFAQLFFPAVFIISFLPPLFVQSWRSFAYTGAICIGIFAALLSLPVLFLIFKPTFEILGVIFMIGFFIPGVAIGYATKFIILVTKSEPFSLGSLMFIIVIAAAVIAIIIGFFSAHHSIPT